MKHKAGLLGGGTVLLGLLGLVGGATLPPTTLTNPGAWVLVEDGQEGTSFPTMEDCQRALSRTLKVLDLMAHDRKVTGNLTIMTPRLVVFRYTGGSTPPSYHSAQCRLSESLNQDVEEGRQ